ncbi:hypothetical protein LTS18_008010 [Coniosporium uncinatum]|uniref:Uncharacterized protein n=1 Tax=Coniosporium uncinatum TaxID=93489 RepID=A0ACC3DCK7_9PEZI|nr:hypothetical protein LTS18_008010 [Coniosporium uncinatum]
MAISGFLCISWRLAEILTLIPTVGMLSWFVHGYTQSNMHTPPSVLVLFIVSVLGLAWAFFTLLFHAKSKHSGKFVAFIDLLFVGAFIAEVYYLRGIADADCSNFSADSFYLSLGVFGYIGRQGDSPWAANINKNCAMLKAAFALLLALLVARHHRKDDLRRQPPVQLE